LREKPIENKNMKLHRSEEKIKNISDLFDCIIENMERGVYID